MGLFKIFKKREKKEEKEVIQETFKEVKDLPKCAFCEEYVELWEKSRKFDNKRFHSKCFKKLKKQATKLAFG